jgi:hypothetical protein
MLIIGCNVVMSLLRSTELRVDVRMCLDRSRVRGIMLDILLLWDIIDVGGFGERSMSSHVGCSVQVESSMEF